MTSRSTARTLAVIAVLATLACAIATASANRLSISNRSYRLVWSSVEFSPGGIRCPLTLEGSFHSATMRKVIGALVGHVSKATFANCTGGRFTALQETLPWHVQYRLFEGALPTISGVAYNLIGLSVNEEIPLFGVACLIRTTAMTPFSYIARTGASGTVTSVRIDETRTILLTGGCAILGESNFAGEGKVFLLGTTASISVRLI